MDINKVLKYGIVAGLFSALLVPLVVTESLFFPFIAGKGFFFRIVTEIIFGAWIILALHDPSFRLRRSTLFLSIVGLMIITLLANVFGEYFYKSFWSNFERMEGFVSLIHMFMYFIVAGAVMKSKDIWYKFFHTSITVSLFMSLFAIMQLSGELVINQGGIRVDATFGNAIYFAGFLVTHIFFVALMWLRRKDHSPNTTFISAIIGFLTFAGFYIYKMQLPDVESQTGGMLAFTFSILAVIYLGYFLLDGRRLQSKLAEWTRNSYYGLLIALYLVLIIYTATRGAILALVGSAIIYVISLAILRWDRKGTKKIVAGALIVLIILGGLFFSLRNSEFVQNNKVLERVASISLEDDDIQARFDVWGIAWQGFKDRPILGWGQENFNYVFNKYYDPDLFGREQWFDRAHNIVFDWLVTTGVLGFLAYLSLFYFALRIIWKGKEKEGYIFTDLEKSLLTAFLASYFLFNIVVFDNVSSYILFFAFLAFLYTSKKYREIENPKRISNAAIWQYGIIVLLVMGFSLYYLNARPISAGTTLIDALQRKDEGPLKNLELFREAIEMNTFATFEIREQLANGSRQVVESDLDISIKEPFLVYTEEQLLLQNEIKPDDTRYELYMAIFYMDVRNYEKAIPWFEKALESSPTKVNIMQEFGSAYVNLQRNEEGLQWFKKAYELAPWHHDTQFVYAAGAIIAGRNDLAESILSQYPNGALHGDDRLATAYFRTRQFDKLIAVLEQKVVDKPDRLEFKVQLARTYRDLGDRDNALRVIRIMIEEHDEVSGTPEQIIEQI